MLSTNRGIWQALIPLWFLLISVFAQMGCACEPTGQAQSNKTRPCIPQHARRAVASPLKSKTIVPGTIPASVTVTDSGDAALSMSLEVPPGRAGVEPSLAISYSSASGDSIVGAGFSISGASAITRCPKTMAIDGEIRAVQYDKSDAYCLDMRRLVLVAEHDTSREFRTIPDTQVKVVEHLASGGASYFEAFLPDGSRVLYGASESTRPMANTGVPRAWLAEEQRDPRGNMMAYGYCFAEVDDYVAEYALDEIRYTGFGDEDGTRAVSFVYETKDPDDVRMIYSAGMAFQQSLQLNEVQMSVNDQLVRRYEFKYDQSETTGRNLLQSVQECGADGACKPETRFQYAKPTRGVEEVATTIAAPISKLSSSMIADFNGDGLDDLLTLPKVPTAFLSTHQQAAA